MLLLHQQRTEYQDSYRDPDELRRQQNQGAKAPPKKKKPEIFSIAPQKKPQLLQQQ